MRLDEFPLERRPREKARLSGLGSLSDEELLALLLAHGYQGVNAVELARDLLNRYLSFSGLASCPLTALEEQKGVKKAKALELAAVFEVARRWKSSAPLQWPYVPKQLYERYAQSLGESPDEKLVLLLLNRRGSLLYERLLYQGSSDEIAFAEKAILSAGLAHNASFLLLAHNHPGGNPLPSSEDLTFTHDLARRLGGFDLRLLDHLIVAGGSYYSFKENRLL